jgi:hypothetical protein
MKRIRKTQAAGVSRMASLSPQSIWRRILKLFRHRHDPLLVANLTVFNEPRIYLAPDFRPPMYLVVSQL